MIEEDTHRATSYQESAWEARNSAAYGHALRLLWSTNGKQSTLGKISRGLWPAIRLKQIEFLFNSKGAPVGYVTWAFLTNTCIHQLRNDPSYVLHLSEWNEGDQLWIMDVVAIRGYARNLIRKLRDKRLHHADYVQALRTKPDQTNVRQIRLKIFKPCPHTPFYDASSEQIAAL